MSHLIQALESRRLLSATAASLGAELGAVNTTGATVKADLKALAAGAKADLSLLTKDLKGSASTNAALLKKAQTDETKYIKRISADVTALLNASAVSKSSVTDGNAVIKAPANAVLATKIGVDATALLTAATKPQTKLIADSSTATIDADLTAIATANPTITQATTARTHFDAFVAKLLTDANTYTNAVGTLRVDLTTLLPAPTTTPSLVGDYKGTFKTKAIAFGLGSVSVPFEILIISQTINSVTGSISAAGNSASGTITATEVTTGKLTLKISNTSLTVNLVGVVNVTTTKKGLPPGSVITGAGTVSVAGYNISGTFIVTKVT